MSDTAKRALIALGSNVTSPVGEPIVTVKSGLLALAGRGWRILATSRFYATPCFPPGAGDDYVNAACSIEIPDSADARVLLADLHSVENEYGRARTQRWGSRSLDLDLIAWGDAVMPDRATLDHWMALPAETQSSAAPGELILPHPRVQDRSFVLVPLADIAPDWVHPVLGLSVVEMRDARPEDEREEIVALPD